MAKQIYRSGNYVIAIDANDYLRDFPMSKTVITETSTQFIIKEGQIAGSELVIDISDIQNWKNDRDEIYEFKGLQLFLRENTASF